jgi:UDP-GlcNAc3NAcA epimerase
VAVNNLAREGITIGVHAVGDVMFDTTLAAVEQAKGRSRILKTLGLTPKSYAVSTIHRAENTDDRERFVRVMAWLEEAAVQVPIVLPTHPRTRQIMARYGISPKRVRLIEPLGYLDMVMLVHHASAIYTDSGGLQKEAYFHRVPCVTLRDETEWTETIEAGWNRLWTAPEYAPGRDITDYGTGQAAHAIVAAIKAFRPLPAQLRPDRQTS